MPGNAIFDATNRIDTSYSFRIIRSEVKDALSLGRGAALYSNSGFDLGSDARVKIGAFAMVDNAQIVCDERIRIAGNGLISWNVLIMDNYGVPCSMEKRRA